MRCCTHIGGNITQGQIARRTASLPSELRIAAGHLLHPLAVARPDIPACPQLRLDRLVAATVVRACTVQRGQHGIGDREGHARDVQERVRKGRRSELVVLSEGSSVDVEPQ